LTARKKARAKALSSAAEFAWALAELANLRRKDSRKSRLAKARKPQNAIQERAKFIRKKRSNLSKSKLCAA
jgi:hypothetical protein